VEGRADRDPIILHHLYINSISLSLFLCQFELDIEPRLKPSLSGGGRGLNDSQDLSFSQAPNKGMQPQRETVSQIEMLTRAGKLNPPSE
jgi:hypothetical protein